MKKKFEAFLREENSLRELAVTDAGKPAVDTAFLQRWQSKINKIAMESNRSIVLILRITPASIGILLKGGNIGQHYIDRYLANGLYCESGMGNSGLLITNRDSSGSADGNPSGMSSLTACFGLPIQWPDEALFGVVCVLNQSGKTLKQASRDILLELRETIEQELILLHSQVQSPQTPQTDVLAAVGIPVIEQAPPVSHMRDQAPQTPETDAPSAVRPPVIEQAPPVSHMRDQAPQTRETDAPSAVRPPVIEQAPPVSHMRDQAPQTPETDALTSIHSRLKIEDILKHEFDRAKRYFKTFTVTMIDLGGPQISGREVGDDILKAFALSIGAKIRETDFWGRWGGDVFVLVCPYADTVETQQMFTRIRPLVYRDMKAVKAFSDFYYGVSQYEPDDLTYQAIVSRAQENIAQYKDMVRRKSFAAADDQNAGIR